MDRQPSDETDHLELTAAMVTGRVSEERVGFGQNSLSFSLDSPAESVAGSEGRDENVSLNRDGDDQLQQRQTGVRVAEDASEGAGNTAHTNIDLGEVSAQGVTQKQLEEVQGQMVAVMTRQMAAS